MKTLIPILLFIIAMISVSPASSQEYNVNGNASVNNCHCYTLTQEQQYKSGSVWNKRKIDLNNSFDFNFTVNLGTDDGTGADGIAFMLQQVGSRLGGNGNGLGFAGIVPSIGIILDTHPNAIDNDPLFDHISIQSNGVYQHGADLDGPVQASPTSGNIEDGKWHFLRITWDATSHLLRAYFDNVLRVEAPINLISGIFNNDPDVYWGFSASTGDKYNIQQFCTALDPAFNTNLENDSTCSNDAVVFTNTSQSFAPVSSYSWDFGDGTTSSEKNPIHKYSDAGGYKVKLSITGFDGCPSDTFTKKIEVLKSPIADFEIFDTCSKKEPRLIDKSTAASSGSITNWQWDLNGSNLATLQDPSIKNLSPGNYQLSLQVTSRLGCTSMPLKKEFNIRNPPSIVASSKEFECVKIPMVFKAVSAANAAIKKWQWNFGDGTSGAESELPHTYAQAGEYVASVLAIDSSGCESIPYSLPVKIYKADANAGNDTTLLQSGYAYLHGTGGVTYEWSPTTGLDNPNIPNPVATLWDDQSYTLTVTTAEGCKDTDEVKITAYKDFAVFIPTAFTPNGDGLNDQLRPTYRGVKAIEYFMIYNRGGERVFSSKIDGGEWDGTFRGVKQPTGVFVWMARVADSQGNFHEQKGILTLIR